MHVRPILAWMLILLLLAAGGMYYALDQVWDQRHEFIREGLERALAEHLPDWRFEFHRVRLEDHGRLRIEDLTLAPIDSREVLLSVPEMVLELDQELLRSRRVFVRRVRVMRPVVRVVRDALGTWNIASLPTVESEAGAPPEVIIHDGTILVRLDETPYTPSIEVGCRHVEGGLVPSGWQQYELHGETTIDHAGSLQLAGHVDLLRETWSLEGTLERLNTGDQLFEIAAGFSDEVRTQMESLAGGPALIRTADATTVTGGPSTPWMGAMPPPVAPISATGTAQRGAAAPPNLGIQAVVDVSFALSQAGPQELTDYIIQVAIRGGTVNNPAIPLPLSNLGGRLSLTPEELVIQDVTAENGASRLLVNGRVSREERGRKSLTLQARHLTLSQELGRQLPLRLRDLYAMISPAGNFDVDVHLETNGLGPWQVTLNEFTAQDCTAVHALFQYPVRNIQGTIQQRGEEFHVSMRGLAGRSPVTLTGVIVNPGPEAAARFDITAAQLPIDEAFLSALSQERWMACRQAIESLALRGIADWKVTLVRPAGNGQRWLSRLHGKVSQGTVNYARFPWLLSEVGGEVSYDDFTDRVWRFDNLVGRHGDAVVTGRGTFTRIEPPGLLDLQLTALNLNLDTELRNACVVVYPPLDGIWEEINPGGKLNLHNLRMLWVPGVNSHLDLTIPSIVLTDGQFTLRSLPYTWNQVAASGDWKGGRLNLHNLTGWHEGTFLQIDGKLENSAFIEGNAGRTFDWHLHCEDIALQRLQADDTLRRALPRHLSEVLETIDPRGPFNVRFGLDMKGFPPRRGGFAQEPLVTASWRMEVVFKGNDLMLGVELKNATGTLNLLEGTWDGETVNAEGWAEFESFEAFELPLRRVSAPFQLDGNWLIVGSPDWLEQGVVHLPENPRAGKSVDAELYGGELQLNAVVSLAGPTQQQTQYRVDAHLRHAKLERWVEDQRRRSQTSGQFSGQLSGEVFGDLWLAGRGASRQNIQGAGRVQIMPAALYELPVIVQVFSAATFEPPDRTAFRYAYGEFGLEEGQIQFSQIRLIGQSIALVGGGGVGFAEHNFGQLSLDFQVIPQNRIPLIGNLLQGIGGRFVTVHVDGTMDQPMAVSRGRIPIPVLDEVVQAVLGSWESNQTPMLGPFTPQRPLPRIGPTAQQRDRR